MKRETPLIILLSVVVIGGLLAYIRIKVADDEWLKEGVAAALEQKSHVGNAAYR